MKSIISLYLNRLTPILWRDVYNFLNPILQYPLLKSCHESILIISSSKATSISMMSLSNNYTYHCSEMSFDYSINSLNLRNYDKMHKSYGSRSGWQTTRTRSRLWDTDFAATASETLYEVNGINEMKLNDVVEDKEHVFYLCNSAWYCMRVGNTCIRRLRRMRSSNKRLRLALFNDSCVLTEYSHIVELLK